MALAWDANPEADLLGYLLYRDGELVNATGPVVDDLKPFALAAASCTDAARPDGTFRFRLRGRGPARHAPTLPAAALSHERSPLVGAAGDRLPPSTTRVRASKGKL